MNTLEKRLPGYATLHAGYRTLVLLFLFGLAPFALPAAEIMPENLWVKKDANGQVRVTLYFFWSKRCPHCLDALPHVRDLAARNPHIHLVSRQLIGNPDAIRQYEGMAISLGQVAQSVPAFMFCRHMQTGFDPVTTVRELKDGIARCKTWFEKHGTISRFSADNTGTIQVPVFGRVDTTRIGLTALTLILGSVDAFNPCAFFVLMFLMSLLLHTRNRKRMVLVGGIFVLFSGLMYFAFMAAWFNLFRLIGHLQWITVVAALIAVTVGLINIKDFFWFKKGVSLTLSENAKPGLFARMRKLLQQSSLSTLVFATVTLAFFANLYEFLCTAGFPMVYTRILTLNNLPLWQYYLWLGLYNLIYIIPLLIIVLLFVWTMGQHKLKQSEGENLKLVSGFMMLALGLTLLTRPELLQHIGSSVLIMISAVLLAVAVVLVRKKRT